MPEIDFDRAARDAGINVPIRALDIIIDFLVAEERPVWADFIASIRKQFAEAAYPEPKHVGAVVTDRDGSVWSIDGMGHGDYGPWYCIRAELGTSAHARRFWADIDRPTVHFTGVPA